ncbi:hypothetical protein ACFY4B_17115 [Kitasatospora sp. NPDC001261]|uniref:hypothetical protein n=1 Tax=Kitasatospora sp. NPDC001261 TaxID=3364012 RepID=UPI00367EFF2B
MKPRWKVLGAVVLSFVVAVVGGWALFLNGYGPLALAGRSDWVRTGQAKDRVDRALRVTMDGITPALSYAGADFEVLRKPDLWDGEPSMGSDLTEIVVVRTVVSQAKLPALMDQVAQAWKGLGNRVVERSKPADGIQGMDGMGNADGETYLTFLAKPQQDSTYRVKFLVGTAGVLYQPAHEYKPLPPLGRAPYDADGYVIDPVDDPYWSH